MPGVHSESCVQSRCACGVVQNVTVKVDPQYRFSNDSFAVYTSANLVSGGANKTGSCFNVSCHFRPSPKWSNER